jgi:hypothetical protein
MEEQQELTKILDKLKDLREDERRKIVKLMKKRNLMDNRKWIVCDKRNSGSGSKSYGSRRASLNYNGCHPIAKYDLSNWKYIEFKWEKQDFCLSLQSFDKDFASGNNHLLDQRLSLYESIGKNETVLLTVPTYKDKKGTLQSFDLPLTDKKRNMLLNYIDMFLQWYCKKPNFNEKDLGWENN